MRIPGKSARSCPRHRGRYLFDLLELCGGQRAGQRASADEQALARRLGFHPAAAGEQKRSFQLVHDGTFTWLVVHPHIRCAHEIPLRREVPVAFEFVMGRRHTTGLAVRACRTAARGVDGVTRDVVDLQLAGNDGRALAIVVELLGPEAMTASPDRTETLE